MAMMPPQDTFGLLRIEKTLAAIPYALDRDVRHEFFRERSARHVRNRIRRDDVENLVAFKLGFQRKKTRVGSGVARHAAALGARVTVSEVDPVAALQAAFAGYAVEPLADAAAHADVLISTTGIAHTVAVEHLDRLPEGAAVAVGGGAFQEISLRAALDAGAVETSRRGAVSVLRLANGRSIRVLDDGHCINVSAAEGNPIQVMDLSFGVQLSAVDYLIAGRGTLTPAVHILPRSADDRVAALALGAFGGGLDAVSSAQSDYLTSWRPRDVTP